MAKGNEKMDQPNDTIEMLTADHQRVKELFDRFEAANGRSSKARQKIVEEVFMELEIHTRLEEEIFYPAVDATADEEGEKLVAESVEEHHVVNILIEEMRAIGPADERYEAKFTVLMENVKHHIEEEEGTMFPMVRKKIQYNLKDLRDDMEDLKEEIMAS